MYTFVFACFPIIASFETQGQLMGTNKGDTTGEATGEGKVGVLCHILSALSHGKKALF